MYNLVTIKDTIRIPPNLFSSNIEESVLSALRHQYENRLDKKLGVVITVTNPKNISDGKIILGDGASYHDVEFDLVTFKPELHEVIHAKVTDLQEFGPFIRFGPIEGLVHVSQVTDDFMSMNQQTGALSGKESKRVLKVGDEVYARVIAVSLKDNASESKINLTMRQAGLGNPEWAKLAEKKKEAKTQEPKAPKKGAKKK
ncbi:MAG: DNA-directed RNA polymerase [DPANN group archaeon]|nr:DNA-directed RNA polymerase [DPANN group archaeon]